MWKWTNDENIKAIILDLDSLSQEYISYPFEQDIKIYEVSKNKINNKNSKHIQIEYIDCVELLYSILQEASFDSTELIAISSDSYFLKEMMQNHIGTIYAGNIDTKKLKHAPDFSNKNLNHVLTKDYVGYAAEALLIENCESLKKVLLQCNSQIILSDGTSKNIQLIFGGRYYPLSRKYFIDDPLSVVIRGFKHKYNNKVDIYYDGVLSLLKKNNDIDILTYVPLKPAQIKERKFDRFASLKLKNTSKSGINLISIIKCNQDFSQKQNDAYHRSENVKDAFELTADVTDKTVVVLDDLYSTGATINEIGKLLYENGAKKVIAVFLAVNQMTESISQQFQHIKCPVCGHNMKLKISGEGKLFFGCYNYPNCTNSLDCSEGLKQLKQVNSLRIKDILDLEDIY